MSRFAAGYGPQTNGPNLWKGLMLGFIGGAAGVYAMNSFMSRTGSLFEKIPGGRLAPEGESASLVGRRHKEGEPSTAALGRIAYRAATGEEPHSEELKKKLGNLVHWSYGVAMGGAYGATRTAPVLDIDGGITYGAVLWAMGDEGAVPLLGLADSPLSFPPSVHAKTLAAHCVYGAVTAVTTNALKRLFGESNGKR